MHYKKYRWSKDYEAAEEELELLLQRLSHNLTRWEAAAYEDLPAVKVSHERELWCAEGSLQLFFGDKAVTLQPGDAITIAADQPHHGSAGVAGCVCYEALS